MITISYIFIIVIYLITVHQPVSIKYLILKFSEGLCDTEDWSNNAENSALHHRNKLHFNIYSNRKLSL